VARVEDFERAIDGRSPEAARKMLTEQAHEFKGKILQVRGAVVASTYLRKNQSRIYFGFNYDPEDHLYLSEIDPPLDERLANHRNWVSVVRTYPSRQISFELPVSEQDFDRLEKGTEVSFTCRIAALIRGKSVYCDSRDLVINR
jgi:hypothetical protein